MIAAKAPRHMVSTATSSRGPRPAPAKRRAGGAVTLVLLVGALGALLLLGHGQLAGPSDWSPDGLASWAADRDPVTAAMAILRLGALGAGAQALLAGAIGALGGALHLSALVRLADLVTLPGMRGLVTRLAGIGLSASTLLTPAAIGTAAIPAPATAPMITMFTPAPGPTAPVVARRLPDASNPKLSPTGAHTATVVRLAEDTPPPPGAGSATMILVEPDTAGPPTSAPDRATPSPEVAPDAPARWLVRPGDHLWSISEATLTRSWSRGPSDGEVDRYWRQLIRVNGDLADPDLIFAGQQIILPPVPPA